MRRRRAFTLLELILAMLVSLLVAAMLYGALRIGFKAGRSVESAIGAGASARSGLGVVAEDLLGAARPVGILSGGFEGQDIADELGRPVDVLVFHTTSPRFRAAAPKGAWFKVEFKVVAPAEAPSSLGAARSAFDQARNASVLNFDAASLLPEPLTLPADPTAEVLATTLTAANPTGVLVRDVTVDLLSSDEPQVYRQVLARDVTGFDVRYHDGEAWREEWFSGAEDNYLPVSVELRLSFTTEPDTPASADGAWMAQSTVHRVVPMVMGASEAARRLEASGG
ncbi:MAG: type II secretion system protein GspJ [Planctomycetota bacterium]